MGTDQAPAAGAGGLGRRDRGGQPLVRRGGAVSLSRRHSLARSAGALWRLENVHRRFSRWAKSGIWEKIFQYLAADADNQYAMLDSTIVRAHQHSAGAQKKPARTKRSGIRAAD